jgi:superfamily II DNA or RNA helicase
VLEFAEQREYEVTNLVPTPEPNVYGADVDAWLETQELVHPVRDYQKDALRLCLNSERGIIVSPTGSGKSYIIWLLTQALAVPQTLIIVPTIGLVTQMKGDFESYGCDPDAIHTIQAGANKQTDRAYTISTWQSIYDLPADYFAQYELVVCDEVHLAKAASLKGLMEKADAKYRFGFTGTITDTQAHRLILEGLFGDVSKVTTTTALVKREELAPLHVKMVVLEYPEQTRKNLRHTQYQDEVDFIVGDLARSEFIAQTVAHLKGNTLVLFTLIDKHGKYLYERIRELCPNKAVHFVTGSVGADGREEVRQTVENTEDTEQVIVASFGVFSTGVNLRRLHNLVFASAGKSKIRTLQSIGRGLRTHASKTKITIYDIVDDFRIGKRENYAWKHAQLRAELYAQEKFPVTLHRINMEHYAQASQAGRLPV